MKTLLGLFLILFALTTIKAEKIRYDDYQVYKILIENEGQLKIINDLKKFYNLNFWKPFNGIGSESHIMVSPKDRFMFERILKVNQFTNEILISNVQSLIDSEESSLFSTTETFGWNRYYNLTDIEKWMDDIIKEYSTIVTPLIIGKSFEGRTIRGIKISYKKDNPGIFIESNIHAREWITSATATYLINELLTSKNKDIRDIAENVDWYIIPVFNVDGFAYSHEKDRMWRKTRQPNSGSKCIGTDANRNFDSFWMANNGASREPCSETFGGPSPFSEPETKALSEFVIKLRDKIKIFLSFHSYGQYLLSPYGHSATEFPDNDKDIRAVAKASVDAIAEYGYSTKYTYGPTASVLYVASGSTPDWAYTTQNIRLAYTYEFRDNGRYGFVLPPVQIKPNAEEIVSGLVALVKKATELGYLN